MGGIESRLTGAAIPLYFCGSYALLEAMTPLNCSASKWLNHNIANRIVTATVGATALFGVQAVCKGAYYKIR